MRMASFLSVDLSTDTNKSTEKIHCKLVQGNTCFKDFESFLERFVTISPVLSWQIGTF